MNKSNAVEIFESKARFARMDIAHAEGDLARTNLSKAKRVELTAKIANLRNDIAAYEMTIEALS